MKKRTIPSLLIIIFILILTGCSSKLESVLEHDERLAEESQNRQEILEQLNKSVPDSVSDDSVDISSKKQTEANTKAECTSSPGNIENSDSKPQNTNALPKTNSKSNSKKKKNTENTGKQTANPRTTNSETMKPKAAATETTTEQTRSEYIIVYITISCIDVLSHSNYKNDNSLPSNGLILSKEITPIKKGDSVFTAVHAICSDKNIQFSYNGSMSSSTVYINSIYHLKEKEYGKYSGWMYKVNGTSPGVGLSEYTLKESDQVEIYYVTS